MELRTEPRYEAKSSTIYTAIASCRTQRMAAISRPDTAQKPKDKILLTASPRTWRRLVAGGTGRLVAVALQRQQNLAHAGEI